MKTSSSKLLIERRIKIRQSKKEFLENKTYILLVVFVRRLDWRWVNSVQRIRIEKRTANPRKRELKKARSFTRVSSCDHWRFLYRVLQNPFNDKKINKIFLWAGGGMLPRPLCIIMRNFTLAYLSLCSYGPIYLSHYHYIGIECKKILRTIYRYFPMIEIEERNLTCMLLNPALHFTCLLRCVKCFLVLKSSLTCTTLNGVIPELLLARKLKHKKTKK